MDHYHHTIKSISEEAEVRGAALLSELKALNERTHEQLQDIGRAAVEFLTTGFADLAARKSIYTDARVHQMEYGRWGFDWVQFFRRLAKEHRRPFITTHVRTEYRYDDAVYKLKAYVFAREVWLPKRRYLEPLIVEFRLMGDTAPVKLALKASTKSNLVTFTGNEGLAMYAEWRQRCATDKDFRKALRLGS
jgi:hypothetical protein